MSMPIEDLTPRQIVGLLDQFIVGQAEAKRAVAVALRNRFRRQQLAEADRDEVLPKNILMMGPTGVGKTEIARRLAQIARAPFIKVEATKFTEVGYVGRDVDGMIRDLVNAAVRLLEREKMEAVLPEAKARAEERLLDMVDDGPPRHALRGWAFGMPVSEFGGEPAQESEEETEEAHHARRQELRRRLNDGEFNDRLVDVMVEEQGNPFVQVFSPQGVEEMGLETAGMGGPFGARHSTRTLPVKEARDLLVEEEAKRMIDKVSLHREAIRRTEQTGIIFIDEIDKVAGKSGGTGPDVSREGVQRDLLPIIEGATVATRFGPVRTDHILFIAAGAFHISKPSDLIPELQGRLPIQVELHSLSEVDFRRILSEPKNALVRQYELLLGADGVTLELTPDALDEIAHQAGLLNQKAGNIGARRLHTIMERLLEEVLYEAPEIEQKQVRFDRKSVQLRLGSPS